MSRRTLIRVPPLAALAAASRSEAATAPRFPPGFAWGAATAAYQIEGGAAADGKGPSVWDMFVRKRGAIAEGHKGDVACNSYERWRDDVELCKRLGLRAYRFSVSWPRVLPEGTGTINAKGLDHYDRLVDALLAVRVEPWLTLFHWDLPLALHHRGGWLARDSAAWFGDYADAVARRLGDRVPRFMTLNEPQVVLGNGYKDGTHAPGERYSTSELLLVNHNLLRAHGAGVRAVRASAKRKPKLGMAAALWMKLPADDTAATVEAARAGMFDVGDGEVNAPAMQLDPMLLGRYPEAGLKTFASTMPAFPSSDLDEIAQPIDFVGLNLYFGARFRAGPDGKLQYVPFPAGFPTSAFGWPILPEVLYWGPRFVHERYRKPIVITENGLSCHDWPSTDGGVHDAQRIDFLRRHLRQLARVIADGTPVEGYFHWSLLDNFEWAEGYKQRFGLVHVDFATGKRTPKDSAAYYRDVIAKNAID